MTGEVTNFLEEILKHKRIEVEAKKKKLGLADLKSKLSDAPQSRSFKEAISKSDKVNLIAEIKRASPSAGLIRKDFDPVKIAKVYQEAGATAISILTDEKFFRGHIDFLSQVREVVSVPLLRKDFIIDEYQIYESRTYGADALLLIASILSKEEMTKFLSLSHDLGMDCIVEVHNEEELERVLETPAEIIGINNRDLSTFQIDLFTTQHLRKLIPADKIIVAQSGIQSREDVQLLAKEKIDAILVGESLLRSKDIREKMEELVGITPNRIFTKCDIIKDNPSKP
ncbi:indole-3-glycerol phosphate synthase TrpC [candidate division NPL-UPA2 bacterium]|nr:indole-3-glycerol phosphate synthase TrpC [candidate division NPL-UPA2 bacterium]